MEQEIFKQGSTTYYWASKFFPKDVRSDVFALYSFLRVIDDLVDQTQSKTDEFYRLKNEWQKNSDGETIIANILCLQKEGKVKRGWVSSFFDSMEFDLKKTRYKKLEDTLQYTYGSAEVVGLMMAGIMNLPNEAKEAARVQGRAFQWLNFIRDIEEDNQLGRQYFPAEDLKKFGLKDLSKKTALSQPADFTKFMHFQIECYEKWQQEAEAGYQYIPKRLLIPIKTAADMYQWTANQIEKDPFVIFQKKVKPNQARILYKVLTVVV